MLGLLANEALDVNFAMLFIFGVITDQIKLGKELKGNNIYQIYIFFYD